jgi:hypothetical protein
VIADYLADGAGALYQKGPGLNPPLPRGQAFIPFLRLWRTLSFIRHNYEISGQLFVIAVQAGVCCDIL